MGDTQSDETPARQRWPRERRCKAELQNETFSGAGLIGNEASLGKWEEAPGCRCTQSLPSETKRKCLLHRAPSRPLRLRWNVIFNPNKKTIIFHENPWSLTFCHRKSSLFFHFFHEHRNSQTYASHIQGCFTTCPLCVPLTSLIKNELWSGSTRSFFRALHVLLKLPSACAEYDKICC